MNSEDEHPADQFQRLVRQRPLRNGVPDPGLASGAGSRGRASGLRDAARSVLQRMAAALHFDSRNLTPQAAGMRTAATETRHLLFSAKGRDIDLRVAPAAGGFALSGQVLGPDESGRVELAAHVRGSGPSRRCRAAPLDDLGEFHIDEVEQGTYVLTLKVGGDEIVLPPIDVGLAP